MPSKLKVELKFRLRNQALILLKMYFYFGDLFGYGKKFQEETDDQERAG